MFLKKHALIFIQKKGENNIFIDGLQFIEIAQKMHYN